MCKYFQKSKLTVGWEFQVRDLKLCDKLIDIVLEEDKYYRSWLHNCYGSVPHKQLEFPIYINIKNYKRFMPKADLHMAEVHMNPHIVTGLKISLRQQKALYLYNKIRAYRMEHWWD